MSSWPAVLKLKTRRILDGNYPFPKEGILQMQNINRLCAYLKQTDLNNGQLILYDSETQLSTSFQSVGEMFDAGWIADLQTNSHFHSLTVRANTKETKSLTDKEAARIVPFKTRNAKE